MRNKFLISSFILAIVFSGIVTAYETGGYDRIDETMMTISAGHATSFVIKPDSSLWAWGHNWFGQLGDGTTTERHTPVRVMDNVALVSAGVHNTMAIQADGSLWAWGRNGGRLGDSTTIDRHTPVRIMEDVVAVCVNAGMAIRTDGSLWAWGSGWLGRFGDGSNEDIIHLTPVKIMEDVVSVSAGVSHTVAIKADGSL